MNLIMQIHNNCNTVSQKSIRYIWIQSRIINLETIIIAFKIAFPFEISRFPHIYGSNHNLQIKQSV